jgi:hypothetical protein
MTQADLTVVTDSGLVQFVGRFRSYEVKEPKDGPAPLIQINAWQPGRHKVTSESWLGRLSKNK